MPAEDAPTTEMDVEDGEASERRHRPRGVQVASEALAALAPEWAALHAAIPGAPVFLHPGWQQCWLRQFGAPVQPVFLSFRLEEALIAVAALEFDGDTARQLGDPNLTDYAGVLVARGHEAAVADALFDWLAADMTQELKLWGMPADAPFLAALAESAPANAPSRCTAF